MTETQTFGMVLRAEFTRFLKKRSRLVWLAVFVVAGIAVTAGMVEFGDYAQTQIETSEQIPFAGYGLAHSLLAFAIGIVCSSAVAGEYADHAMAASLLIVPRRGRFVSAQLVVWMVVAFAVTLITCGILAAMYFGRFADTTQALAGLALTPLAVCATTLVAYACASISRRGSLSVLLFIGIVLVLPMVLGMASGAVPENISQALTCAGWLLPGGAGDNMSDAALLFSDSGKWGASAAALLAWAGASALGSHALFARYSGTSA